MSQVRALYGPQPPSFFSIVFCSLNAYPKLYRAYYCLQMMSVTAYLSDLKYVPLTTLAEARAERQMAEVEERQRKLADLAESALTEVNLNQHALLLHHSASCGVRPMSSMGEYSDLCR